MPITITRCSNNYGPYQFPEKLIPLVITRALAHETIPVYGDGKQIRDWLFVTDHCNAIDLVFHKGKRGEVYNIGGSNEQENITIIKIIIKILQEITGDLEITNELITHVTDRLGHDRRYAINASKIKTDLGWKPDTRFEDGIRETIRWYLNHQNWLKNIESGEYIEFYKMNYDSR